MDREQKTAVVKQLAEELKDAQAIFAVDYRGISVPQAAELRDGLRDADTRFRVVKNRLTLRAADAAGTDTLKEHLRGPTALALVKGDAALAAKTLSRLGSEWELLDYKGGLMDGEELDPDSFTAIARLPGREALNAQLAGTVASPLTGLVRGLGSMIQGLALQLGQIAEQGLVNQRSAACTTSGGLGAVILFVGFNLTFFPQFIMGSQGMPRRYASYPVEFVRTPRSRRSARTRWRSA